MAQNSGNPWAMRVTIIGLVFILLGSVAIFSNVDKIDDAASPKKINEASQTGDGSVTVELSKSSKVNLIHRRDEFRGAQATVDKVKEVRKILEN